MFVSKEQIETLIATKIKDLSLYQRAFTHKSALKEYEQFTESFETLEFMGDSCVRVLSSPSFSSIATKRNRKDFSPRLVQNSFVRRPSQI